MPPQAQDGILSKPVRAEGLRVAVYLGTFDPIHEGHLDAARKCLAAGADEVLFVPNGEIKRKKKANSREFRLAGVVRATAREPGMNVLLQDPSPLMPRPGEDWNLKRLLGRVAEVYGAECVGELCGSDAFHNYPVDECAAYFFGQPVYLAVRPPYMELPRQLPNGSSCISLGETKCVSSTAIREALRDRAPPQELAALGLPPELIPLYAGHPPEASPGDAEGSANVFLTREACSGCGCRQHGEYKAPAESLPIV
ncbi:putative nicotinate-nucleotide adenylyltransferase [Diplonema papillatum]|nr:putative nicotinate-nucleotide adenylyltransferase [Diplonema papillatum]